MEKYNNTSREGPEKTDKKERETVVVAEPALKYKEQRNQKYLNVMRIKKEGLKNRKSQGRKCLRKTRRRSNNEHMPPDLYL